MQIKTNKQIPHYAGQSPSNYNMDEIENTMLKRLNLKDHIFYESIYMKCPEQAIYRDNGLVIPGNWGRERWGVTANEYGLSFRVMKMLWN